MRNVLDKIRRENQNAHFMFNNVFPENRTVYEIISKIIPENEGPQMTSKYDPYAWHAGLARLYARMRMLRPCSSVPTARTHAKAYTHRQICNTYFLSTATVFL
jgi:hypothetical protein